MDHILTDQEKEIVALREEQRLSFRLIGERCGMTTSKATYLYHNACRMLRIDRYHQLRRKQDLKGVSFDLTIGETVVLQHILQLFQSWKISDCRGNFTAIEDLKKDPDYLAAIDLHKRLSALELDERRKVSPPSSSQ